MPSIFSAAAEAIRSADALLIGAGAGMGVDSGLPDFRGDAGFWKAYPMLYGRPFHEISTPHWFKTDPAQAWGFFGHRLNLYRAAIPHEGFAILRRWAEQKPLGYFVFTSNVDGQFQKAGFPEDRIVECHGSINHLQCSNGCRDEVWSASGLTVAVDESVLKAEGELPRCPHCGAIARPNILMFYDADWIDSRSAAQSSRFKKWFYEPRGKKVVAVELGAGLAISTVRNTCERFGRPLIRINPREAETQAAGAISIPCGALEALKQIAAELQASA